MKSYYFSKSLALKPQAAKNLISSNLGLFDFKIVARWSNTTFNSKVP